ncbi:MAG: DUF2249 domain-containing protein [Opitutales bacterium]
MNFQTPQDSGSAQPDAAPSIPEALLESLRRGAVREFDARPVLEAGQEPFTLIMQAMDRLEPGEVFKLQAPFEPVPLYAVLGRKGFQRWARQAGEGEGGFWEIFFYRAEEPDSSADGAEAEEEFAGGDESILELDVRGLEPPEPLERVLEVVEQMAYGEVLRVVHHRNPLILFDVLVERGFQYRSQQQSEELWEIRIWRKD